MGHGSRTLCATFERVVERVDALPIDNLWRREVKVADVVVVNLPDDLRLDTAENIRIVHRADEINPAKTLLVIIATVCRGDLTAQRAKLIERDLNTEPQGIGSSYATPPGIGVSRNARRGVDFVTKAIDVKGFERAGVSGLVARPHGGGASTFAVNRPQPCEIQVRG